MIKKLLPYVFLCFQKSAEKFSSVVQKRVDELRQNYDNIMMS